MKLTSLGTVAAVLLFCSSAYGQADDTASESVYVSGLTQAPAAALNAAPAADPSTFWAAPPTVLYDNGPLVNSPGTGAGGADESVLQFVSQGMSTLGKGHQVRFDNRIADDFTVPPGGWQIDSFTFFAYQTGSTTDSTITAVNMGIWDGEPGKPGSTLVFGDTATNAMTDTAFAQIYRRADSQPGNTQRPVMAQTVGALDLFLPAGTYWVDWQTAGDPSLTGPWAPPITINGETTTGNGLQSPDAGSTWAPALDTETATPQGFPFIITGTEPDRLSCEGFLFPMDQAVTVKRSPYGGDQPSVLPLTMRLLDEDGVPVYGQDLSSPPVLEVLFDGEGQAVPDELPFIGYGDDGNRFEFVNSYWQFYLATSGFGSTGTYYASVVSGDESEYWIDPTCVGTFTIVNPYSFFSW